MLLEFLGSVHDIADVPVAEYAAAVGERLAAKPDHGAVGQSQVERSFVTGFHQGRSLGNVGIHFMAVHGERPGGAVVVQQVVEARLWIRNIVRQVPQATKARFMNWARRSESSNTIPMSD